MGDRICPDCNECTLVEKGLTTWECLQCDNIYTETELDEGIETFDEE